MFLQVSVILLTGEGGVPDQVDPPTGPGTPPQTRYPLGLGTPPRTRYPPGTRYTPQDQVHPPAQSMLGDTVNARAVRILLECNLVNIKRVRSDTDNIFSHPWEKNSLPSFSYI